jgi:NhaP-type Na+/H+ or K+/H+ antiporter
VFVFSTLAVFSTKKVDPHLFYLVFGESVINDAVGLVLFNALAHLVESHQLNVAEDGQELNVSEEVLQFIFDFVISFLGSLVLGTVFALLYGLLFKHVDMRHTKLLELCVYSTMVYSPFVVAEILHLSGIVTVLMTGIAARRYAEPNLSRSTSNHADCLFRMVAHSTETIIFLELGLSVVELLRFGGQQQQQSTMPLNYMFLLCALGACLAGRAANIYPITVFHNIFLVKGGCSCWKWPTRRDKNTKMDGVFKKPLVKTSKKKQATITTLNDEDYYKPTDVDGNIIPTETTTATSIAVPSSPPSVSASSSSDDDATTIKMTDDAHIPWKTANMLWFSGLRGAVSYALVKTFPQTGNEHCFVVTTMLIVLVTTFVFGGGTETALNALHIEMNVDEQEYLKTVERKKLLGNGWLGRFEAYQVRAWVLRDFEKVQKQEEQPLSASGCGTGSRGNDDDREAGAVEKPQDSSHEDDSMLYHEPFEMTEHDHMSVAAAAAANTSGRMKKRRTSKTQLYDFGQ